MKKFKAGDKLRYVGPERTIGQSPADHPSFYVNHEVLSVERECSTGDRPATFAHVECFERDHPEVRCGGYKLLIHEHWEVISEGNHAKD